MRRLYALLAEPEGNPLAALAREGLAHFTRDALWARAPKGPPALEVLRDWVVERGVEVTPRVLAGFVQP
jgi:hypothetical protein